MQPNGTIMKALRNIGPKDAQFPYIYAGDELRVTGYADGDGRMLYVMQTHRNLIIMVDPEDVALPGKPDPTQQSEVEAAFKAGCQKGFECGLINMNQDLFKARVQVETWKYVRTHYESNR